ncbi:DUF3027 domain-containing protein [Nakamurella leprariae]|uniref:DUF3027 domain-containing protein n=1 Tax=Nakamurella leprariae TaxID=2803911 RepID=A0A939BYA1_9ACTN|nr:DUF3027 domain-containing protein [Nakamurella leprariae]MBM9466391.1 DUF3027 domain-containing protein [Nakamurella leprariae]
MTLSTAVSDPDPSAGGSDVLTEPPVSRPIDPSPDLVAVARLAAEQDAGAAAEVGDLAGAVAEDTVAVTVFFASTNRGYHGWRWAVTLAVLEETPPTVSEVVLLPGPDALLAPAWLPWSQRIRAGDVGPGDLLPPPPDDPRLVPSYLESDDPAVEEVAHELGVGRVHVLSRLGREETAERWATGPFGPDSPAARQAPGPCGSCGFYLPLAGALGAGFGACGNEYSPAQLSVVSVGFGCGAHSETEVEPAGLATTTAAVVDELLMDVEPRPPAPADDADTAGPRDESTAELAVADEAVPAEVTVTDGTHVEVTEDDRPAEPSVDEGPVDEAPAAEVEAVIAAVEAAAEVTVPGDGESAPDATVDEPVALVTEIDAPEVEGGSEVPGSEAEAAAAAGSDADPSEEDSTGPSAE